MGGDVFVVDPFVVIIAAINFFFLRVGFGGIQPALAVRKNGEIVAYMRDAGPPPPPRVGRRSTIVRPEPVHVTRAPASLPRHLARRLARTMGGDIRLESRRVQFLYSDGDLYHFMDLETFEMTPISADVLGEVAALVVADVAGRRADEARDGLGLDAIVGLRAGAVERRRPGRAR